jgi:hypothetical protein
VTLAHLPGQGHMAPQFAPELFCAEVLPFLDENGV